MLYLAVILDCWSVVALWHGLKFSQFLWKHNTYHDESVCNTWGWKQPVSPKHGMMRVFSCFLPSCGYNPLLHLVWFWHSIKCWRCDQPLILHRFIYSYILSLSILLLGSRFIIFFNATYEIKMFKWTNNSVTFNYGNLKLFLFSFTMWVCCYCALLTMWYLL